MQSPLIWSTCNEESPAHLPSSLGIHKEIQERRCWLGLLMDLFLVLTEDLTQRGLVVAVLLLVEFEDLFFAIGF
jgi:hypothetical protein